MQQIIDTIKKLINDKGLKHKYVAEQMGLTPQEFSNMLCGRKEFKTEHVVPICKALNITANDLFGLSN